MNDFTCPSRRHVLAGGAAALAGGLLPSAFAQQASEITVFGHRVHQSAATTGAGGDATSAFRDASKTKINWVTLGDVNAIHERLLREASLSSSSIDVAYMLNGRANARNLSLFEPLDTFMKEAPIEELGDFAPGLISPFRTKAGLMGIPVRHSTSALVYNEDLFKERGVDPNFKSFEDVIAAAKKLSFRRDDGTQVYGLSFAPQFASHFLVLSRAIGADYMKEDRSIVAAEEPMIRFLDAMADLYKSGALPRNFATINNEEVSTQLQQGRCAMSLNSLARLPMLNDPAKSKFPGRIKPMTPPVAAVSATKAGYSAPVEFWALMIPKNSQNKRAAWEFIRSVSSKNATLQMAKNGNGRRHRLDPAGKLALGRVVE
ncbi:MAG: extracellular solute-binding protein, partial [Comamonadaceae bacterium]